MPDEKTTELAEKDPILLALEEEFSRIDKEQEYSFQNRYLAEFNSIEACKSALKHQYGVMLKELAARKTVLQYHWHDAFKQAVKEDLAKPENSKKKSVNYLQGRAGYRKSKLHLLVNDEAAAIDWALENDCEGAVDTTLRYKILLLEKYQADGKVPDGCDVIQPKESFFPMAARPVLEAVPEPKELE